MNIFFKKTKNKIENLRREIIELKVSKNKIEILHNLLLKVVYCLKQISTMERTCSCPNPTSDYYAVIERWTTQILSNNYDTLREPLHAFIEETDKYIPWEWLRKRR